MKDAKFLRLIFDTKLTFKNHVQHLKSSCQKALHILRVVAHADWGADRIVLLHLYRALVRSKLDCGCVVYGSDRQSVLKQLDPTTISACVSRWGLFALLLPRVSTRRHTNHSWPLVV